MNLENQTTTFCSDAHCTNLFEIIHMCKAGTRQSTAMTDVVASLVYV